MKEKLKIILVETGDYLQQTFSVDDIAIAQVVGIFKSGVDVIGGYHHLQPEIIFIDMILADITGLEVARSIREQNQTVKIILVSLELRLEFLLASVDAGIDGYIQKNAGPDTLISAMDAVRRGQFFSQRHGEVSLKSPR